MSENKFWIVVHNVNGKIECLKMEWHPSKAIAEDKAIEANDRMQTDEFYAMPWSEFYNLMS